MNRAIIILFGGMFFLSPWYLFDSGSLQPVDIAIFALLLIFFILRLPYLKWIFSQSLSYRYFILLSAYISISLLLNLIIKGNAITLSLAEQNLYYVFLVTVFFIAFCYLYGYYSAEKSYQLILWFILLGSILPFAKFLGTGLTAFRNSLTFNNPNQLGFFALVNLSLFFYLTLMAKREGIKIKKILSLLIMNINVLFIFLAASRACYTALILYAISYLLVFQPKLKGYNLLLFQILGAGVAAYIIINMGYGLFQHMSSTRLAMLPTSYLDLSSDIYYRAFKGVTENFNNVNSFLFGNGTYSAAGRNKLEFHNNFAAIFHQVGLFGFIIYLYLNIIIMRGLYLTGILYLIPYFCYLYYSMFHYSYRTRFNWLFLAFVMFVVLYSRLRKRREKDIDENFNCNNNI